MKRVLLGWAVLLLLTAALSAAEREPRPDAPVPRASPAYDWVQILLQAGLDAGQEYPPPGRGTLTRRQFAQITADLLAQGSLAAGAGWPNRRKITRDWKDSDTPLDRLATEFEPELKLILDQPEVFQAARERFRKLWKTGRPQGVDTPLVEQLYHFDPAARRAASLVPFGYLPVSLMTDNDLLGPELPAAIPLRRGRARNDNDTIELIAEYNKATWQRLRQYGVPKNPEGAQLRWVEQLFHLPEFWKAHAAEALLLDRKHPGAVSADGKLRVARELTRREFRAGDLQALPDGRLIAAPEPPPARHRLIAIMGWDQAELKIPGLPEFREPIEMIWGPPGSMVAYFRVRSPEDREMPFRLYAVELRAGLLLNADFAR